MRFYLHMSKKSSIFAADMRKIVLIVLLGMLCGPLFAQSSSEADRLFKAGDYERAGKLYSRLVAKSPTNALYLYRSARCAYELGDMQAAADGFRRAGSHYQLTHYFLGESLMALWHFEEAEAAYQRYLHALKEPNERVPYVLRQIDKAVTYQRYMKRVTEVCIIDSVEVTKEALLSAYHLSAEAGSLQQDPAGNITYTSQRGDRRFMVVGDSDRRLAYAEKLVDRWNEATLLPENVNRAPLQGYPFCLPDGVTLYFAGMDSLGLGGWDISVSRFNTATNTWTKPENLGLPFNSEANDYMYAEDEKNGVGYFATDRFSDAQHVRVYTFLLPEQKQVMRHPVLDTLVRYARLEAYCTADYPKTAGAVKPVRPDVVPVYEEELTPLEKAEQQLENLRRQYAEADEELRRQLRPAILSLEQTVDSLYNEAVRLKKSAYKKD